MNTTVSEEVIHSPLINHDEAAYLTTTPLMSSLPKQNKSTMLNIPTCLTCISYPPITSSSSSCYSCYSISTSNNNLKNTTIQLSINNSIPFSSYYHHHHHHNQKQLNSSTFNHNDNNNLNCKYLTDTVQCDQYDDDDQYSINEQYKKLWKQSNETMNPNNNDNNNHNNNQLNNLQAWLKYPFEEYDLKCSSNSSFLGTTIKSSKEEFTTNSESIFKIPTTKTTPTIGTTNDIIFNPIESSFSSSLSPSTAECMNMKSVNNNNDNNNNNSTEHLNGYEFQQYQHNHQQNSLFNQPQNSHKFTRNSFDYLNTKISSQTIHTEENKKQSNKTEFYKHSMKYHGHIKKPLNAFMLFMKEMRSQVIAECTLKESAAINQILGRKWHALSSEAQAKYYKLAKQEKELHQRLYPGWSARDNYATQVKRRSRATKINRTTVTTTISSSTTTTAATPTLKLITDSTVIGNNNNNNNNNNNSYETIYHPRKIYSSFPNSDIWHINNHENDSLNISHNCTTTNNHISSNNFMQQFSNSNLLQTLNSTNLPHTYTTPFYRNDTTHLTQEKATNITLTDYDRLYNVNQFITTTCSPMMHDYNHFTLNMMNNSSMELNNIQSSNADQYSHLQSLNKSIKTDYVVQSIMDLNYEPAIHSNDNSMDQNVSLKYLNKSDKIPIISLNNCSTIDPFNIEQHLTYSTETENYSMENPTNATFIQLSSNNSNNNNSDNNQEINEYPCCSTSYIKFHSKNDYFSSKFYHDSLQYYNNNNNNRKLNDLTEFDAFNEASQNNVYLTSTNYLQCHHHHHQNKEELSRHYDMNTEKIPEFLHEYNTMSCLISSNQLNNNNDENENDDITLLTSNESLLILDKE
ncbi:unnamed protein product [Schistosoma turkestanicum]|nr:unnamed protein product [Schistosoma turkestanicum]